MLTTTENPTQAGQPSGLSVIACSASEIDRLRAENARLIEDRARFPDRPDDIGRIIGAHFDNLKGMAESNAEAWRWACTREAVALRQRNELIALLSEIRDPRHSMKWQADKIDAALARYPQNAEVSNERHE